MLIGLDVAVAGAGVGGLASAIAMAQRGAKVRVYERAKTISDIGAGLQISPNGFAVLKALGLGDAALVAGMRSRAVVLRDYRQGREVLRLDLTKHAADLTTLYLHRADLIDLLRLRAVDLGVAVITGKSVQEILPHTTGKTIEFTDGTQTAAGYVVGADGLSSVARQALNTASEPFFTGQVAWRSLVPAGNNLRSEVTVHMGPGRHLVSYPLRDKKLINIVAIEETDQWHGEGWVQPGIPDELRQAFSGFSPGVQALLAQVRTVHKWGLFRHPVAPNWQDDALALVGDAAHPTLPFLAQGANMALEDAWVLAACLGNSHPERYQPRRFERVTKIVATANANARRYHLRNPVLRLGAHSALRLASRFAPRASLSQFDWVYRHDVTLAD